MVILVRIGMKRSNYYVGIFPTINTSLDNPYDDTSLVVESYIKRIYESNSIPICIFLENGEINYRLLEMCDAFILPGGHRINACVYKVLEYAKDALGKNELYQFWGFNNNGAAQISRLLFEEATDINFMVGKAINPAHRGSSNSISFNVKVNLIGELTKCLESMGKNVKVSLF